MAPKKTKKPKPKQKQKQKQIVKQNVKVNVQSSGGGGGSSASPMPAQFSGNASENIRTTNILSQIAESLKTRPPVTVPTEKIFTSTPVNDKSTLDSVFNAPINTNKPVQLGIDNERPIARKKQKQKIEPPENPFARDSGEESYMSSTEYEKPQGLGFGFPSTAYTTTPYGKVVPKFGEVSSGGESSSSLPSMAMGGGKLEEPVFSGFSVYNR